MKRPRRRKLTPEVQKLSDKWTCVKEGMYKATEPTEEIIDFLRDLVDNSQVPLWMQLLRRQYPPFWTENLADLVKEERVTLVLVHCPTGKVTKVKKPDEEQPTSDEIKLWLTPPTDKDYILLACWPGTGQIWEVT
jgi:hypothetical protein